MSEKKSKIAIVACGSYVNPPPYYDDEWEIWAMNEHPHSRVDRMFEMHPLVVQNDYEMQVLRKYDKPVYMLEIYSSIPNSIRYPFREVLDKLKVKPYFTCTMAYQVALAIYEDVKTIGLWGLNLPKGSARERSVERACLEWWLGFAQGRGIEIKIDEGMSLCHANFKYGYEYFLEKTDVDNQIHELGIRTLTDSYLLGNYMSLHEYQQRMLLGETQIKISDVVEKEKTQDE